MFIQTEPTPNPATVKFIPGCAVMEKGAVEFKTAAEAQASPLAERIFAIQGVQGVFFGHDFVSVTKNDTAEWHAVKGPVLSAIMQHFTMGEPRFHESDATHGSKDHELDDEISSQIRELIDTRVRPAVAMDGGDIVFESFDKGIVYLHLKGACSGCPSATATLKSGVETMLRHYVPEVLEVRAVQD